MKMLNGLGESGFITTKKKIYKDIILKLRHAGTEKDPQKIKINNCVIDSLNHKMDTLQASFLLTNLKNLETKRKKRDEIAKIYDNKLKNFVEVQGYHSGERHGRYLYILKCNKRNNLYHFLKKNKIECKIFYSPLACYAPIFRKNKKNLNIENAERLLKLSIALPFHENMSKEQVYYVCEKIRKFYLKNE